MSPIEKNFDEPLSFGRDSYRDSDFRDFRTSFKKKRPLFLGVGAGNV